MSNIDKWIFFQVPPEAITELGKRYVWGFCIEELPSALLLKVRNKDSKITRVLISPELRIKVLGIEGNPSYR